MIIIYLLPHLIISYVYAFNVLRTYPEGDVFRTDNQPHIHYLTGSQASLDVKRIAPPLSSRSISQLNAVTSLWIKDQIITRKSVQSQLELYNRIDDVWNADFLETVIVSYEGRGSATFESEAYDWLKSQGVARIFIAGSISPPTEDLKGIDDLIPTHYISGFIPPGPFVFSEEGGTSRLKIRAVYRLYPDEYDSFLFGAIPDLENGGWIPTNIFSSSNDGEEGSQQFIPVPSRLDMLVSSNAPLAGTRFGLKDIYDAQGLPTAAGSHAYALTHPIPKTTAPSITRLIALGSSMVGKTRTSQFAHGAQPWEFVDVPYSWNPRGDGHLTASASSSGSACAIAGYDWLEFTIGSDTRGSVRKPAALTGVYGIRPSHGSMNLAGVVPLSEEMDTAGFFARHPNIFNQVARTWYAESPFANKETISHFPSRIYYPTEHFPMKNEAAQKLVNDFLESLHAHFGIKTVPKNFTKILSPFLLNGSFPAFQLSSNKLAEYRSWKEVGEPTTKKFIEQNGIPPTFDPVPQKMFARAQSITEQDFAGAVRFKRNFRDAVSKHIFKHHLDSCSDSLFIYDAATGGVPSYRVEEFNHLNGATPFLLTAAGADSVAKMSDFYNFLASMGELPEVTVPIGQVQYFSQISRTREFIPVAVQLVTRKGCDGVLLDLVKALADAGVVRPVQVGRSIY